MLELAVESVAPQPRRFRSGSKPGWLRVDVAGRTEELEELKRVAERVASTGEEAVVDARDGAVIVPVHVFRSDRGLQVVPLALGVVLCGDADALATVVAAADACLANARADEPLDGYHDHIPLYDWYAGTESLIGELTVYWHA